MTCVVHLLKARSDDSEYGRPDPYEANIDNVRFIPIMKFEPVNFEGLCNHLSCETQYDGVIVTSQRAVDVLKNAFALIDNCQHFCDLPAYTVGPTTANRLELIGFKHVYGAETGNGRVLAEKMVHVLQEKQRLLFLAGEVHRDILPRELTAAGHQIDKIIVYRTECYNYQKELSQIKNGDWVVFFSPSHIDQALNELRKRQLDVKIAAIGPTTHQFLLDNGFEVDAVAESPTAECLRDAMK
ncbi:Uroporphyrinogen-III synthase [Wickerhamiella sorbophila]|uniref:Uroporphyrinogen-III synthase n=1 Tax=Wickerhamiella sorbophila TaxID=45607 RepID=A0A2T0FEA3_9ASCO|nr:Uroporphyrinogen-III synthase [Wickerhamiella sorbophila]PRT53338.1 Uroporphyrinogen-III synthase [Wickerhamiella sorbophila]